MPKKSHIFIALSLLALLSIGTIWRISKIPTYSIYFGDRRVIMYFEETPEATRQSMIEKILPYFASLDIGQSSGVVKCLYDSKSEFSVPVGASTIKYAGDSVSQTLSLSAKRISATQIVFFPNGKIEEGGIEIPFKNNRIKQFFTNLLPLESIRQNFMPSKA